MAATGQRIDMSQLLKQPLFWAWSFVLLWGTHTGYTAVVGHWIGLVISLTGLVAALLVVSAMHSRRRKNLYPKHTADKAIPEVPN